LMNLNNNDNAPFSKIISKILSLEGNENENLINSENKNDLNKNEEKPFVIKYNLPSNLNYIMNQFTEMHEGNDDYGKALKQLLVEYNNCLRKINNNSHYFQKLSPKHVHFFSRDNSKIKKRRKIEKNISIKMNKSLKQKQTSQPLIAKRIKSKIELAEFPEDSDSSQEKKSNDCKKEIIGRESLNIIIQKPVINLFYLYGLDTIKDIEQKIIKNQIRKLKTTPKFGEEKMNSYLDVNNDLLYHQDFLSFSKFFFVTLTLKKNIVLGYRNIFIKKIKNLLKNYSDENISSLKLSRNKKLKSVPELEQDIRNGLIKEEKNNSDNSNGLDQSNSDDKLIFESSSDYMSDKDDINIVKVKSTEIKNINVLKSTDNDFSEYLDIINLSNIDSSQFSLMSAFILELDSVKGFNNNILVIFKLYERSFLMNELEFSYANFYSLLTKLDYLMLHQYYQNIINSKEYDNLKMKEYLNIIYLRLKQMEAEGKGIRRKVRIFKTMKLNYSGDALIQELQKRRFSRKYNKLSTKSILQYQNLMNLDHNFLNASLYHLLSMRKGSENEGNNPLKMNILNMYKKYKRTTKDPSQIIEEIGILINLFIVQKSLHKLQPEVITSKFLSNLSNTEEFKKIKDLVAELQVIDLTYLLNVRDNHKTAFWLNILNFLLIFAVIYKKENILTNYEWHKLKKNSYFNIGGFNFSLQEIEMNIIGNNNKSKTFYEEMTSFPRGDSRNKFKIDKVVKYVNFGIFEPMTYSFRLQIYFPQTIENQILKNAIDYFSSKIIFDGKNILVKLPEYLLWVDDNFLKNLDIYKPLINKDLFDFMSKNKDKVEFVKHDWSLNFAHSII